MFTTPTLNTESEKRVARWLDRGLLVLLLLAAAVVFSKNHADPDLWGHVWYGRDVWRDGLPATATYTYTAAGTRWINHENVPELLFAWVADRWNIAVLLWAKCLMGVALCAAILRRAHRASAHVFSTYLVVLLVALCLMHFWSTRPQLFTFGLFAALMLLLDHVFVHWPVANGWLRRGRVHESAEPDWQLATRRARWLWMAPPLFALWANSHGGFVAGYVIFAVYLGCRAFEALRFDARHALPLVARYGLVLTVAGLATLLNPYGTGLHGWLMFSLGSARPEIIEWRAPELLSIAWTPFWLLAGLTVWAAIRSERPRDLTHLVLLGLTLWQAVEHRRHIPFFAILAGLWMIGHIDSALRRGRARESTHAGSRHLSRRATWGLTGCVATVALLLSITLVQQLRQVIVRLDGYPVAAFQYMSDQDLRGKLIVRFKWAQYAIAAFGADDPRDGMQVAFDGRFRTCYPREIVDMYFDFALGEDEWELRSRSPRSPSRPDARLLDFQDPDLVLIGRAQTSAVRTMRQRERDWTLLYQDGLAQLWGRRSRYDDPNSPEFLPVERRRISDAPQRGFVAWPALPNPPRTSGLPA